MPCYNGSNREVRTCEYGGYLCRNSGGYSGNYPVMAGSIFTGTVNLPSAAQDINGDGTPTHTKLTPENLIYGLRGMWGGWCHHTNNYGCACPVSYTHLTLPTKRIV